MVVQVWDTAQCKCLHTLQGHQQPVQRIAICGSRMYSTAGRNIRVWDVATFKCLQVIKTQQDCGALLAMTAAPHGTVYVGGQVSAFPAVWHPFRNQSPACDCVTVWKRVSKYCCMWLLLPMVLLLLAANRTPKYWRLWLLLLMVSLFDTQ